MKLGQKNFLKKVQYCVRTALLLPRYGLFSGKPMLFPMLSFVFILRVN